jgi:hypothetical protein
MNTDRGKTEYVENYNKRQEVYGRLNSVRRWFSLALTFRSRVVSSTAMSPVRAPASMLILHTVIRASMESARIASPASKLEVELNCIMKIEGGSGGPVRVVARVPNVDSN